MSAVTEDPSHDEDDLATFGYAQQLRRRLGPYASFAAGFSFVSILTTVFQLFALGFSFGGAAFFWTWPLVFGGQMLVALCFAELASRYPIAGCIYQWSRRLSNPTVGWFAGWTMLIAQIVTVSAAAIALQVVLPTIWSGFQVVGGNPSLISSTGASNAVLLGTILIAATTTINAVGIRLMSRINSIGVTCELIGVVALVALLFVHAKRGPQAVLHQTGAPAHSGYFGLFIVSALMAAYVMVGFDSAGELSEETRDPRRTAPRAIIKALTVSGVGGGLLLLAAIMAAPSLTNGQLATGGLPYVLTSRLGSTVGKIFLIDVAVAICVCTLAIQTAATRMMFSMSRDGGLPFSRALGHVNAVTGTPIMPAIVTGVLSAALSCSDLLEGLPPVRSKYPKYSRGWPDALCTVFFNLDWRTSRPGRWAGDLVVRTVHRLPAVDSLRACRSARCRSATTSATCKSAGSPRWSRAWSSRP